MSGCLPPELVTEIPGPRSRELAAQLKRYESRNITFVSEHFPVFWERTSGANVWDVDGNRYVDFTSAFGVATMGFSHPAIRQAIVAQTSRLWHAMGDVHPTREKALLCEKLACLTYGRSRTEARVVLCNSGFEAVEAAMMTAHLATGRQRYVAFAGGYHGLGFGARDATGWAFFREPMRSILAELVDFLPFPGCNRCPLEPYRQSLKKILSSRLYAAVIVEPVQGRAGVIVPPTGFLRILREECDRVGTLLIFDEIFTGFWRTGALFACDVEDVLPDMLCLGKSMGGGFPVSACVGRREVMDAWPESEGEALHTSTHLGNPLGCAMALAALEVMERPEFLRKIRDLSCALEQGLQSISLRVPEAVVRGRGVFWGIVPKSISPDESRRRVQRLVNVGLSKGYLLLSGGQSGEVLTLSPPADLAPEIFTQFLEKFLLPELLSE